MPAKTSSISELIRMNGPYRVTTEMKARLFNTESVDLHG
jgi:hypothetical protein